MFSKLIHFNNHSDYKFILTDVGWSAFPDYTIYIDEKYKNAITHIKYFALKNKSDFLMYYPARDYRIEFNIHNMYDLTPSPDDHILIFDSLSAIT